MKRALYLTAAVTAIAVAIICQSACQSDNMQRGRTVYFGNFFVRDFDIFSKCINITLEDIATDIDSLSIRYDSSSVTVGRICDMQVYDDYSFIADDAEQIFCIQNDTITGTLAPFGEERDSTSHITGWTYSPERKTLYLSLNGDHPVLCYDVPSMTLTDTLLIASGEKKLAWTNGSLLVLAPFKDSIITDTVLDANPIKIMGPGCLLRYNPDSGVTDSVMPVSNVCTSLFGTRCIGRTENETFITMPGFINRIMLCRDDSLEKVLTVQFGKNLFEYKNDSLESESIWRNDLTYSTRYEYLTMYACSRICCNLPYSQDGYITFWPGDNRRRLHSEEYNIYAVVNDRNFCTVYRILSRESESVPLPAPLCMHNGFTYFVIQHNEEQHSPIKVVRGRFGIRPKQEEERQ